MSDANSEYGFRKSQLENKAVYQLKSIGKRLEVKGLSKLNKIELVEKLLTHPNIAEELSSTKESKTHEKVVSSISASILKWVLIACTIAGPPGIPIAFWLSSGTDNLIEKAESNIVKNQNRTSRSLENIVEKRFNQTNKQLDYMTNELSLASNIGGMLENNILFAHGLELPEIRQEVENVAKLFDRLDHTQISGFSEKLRTQFYLEKAFAYQLGEDLDQATYHLDKVRSLVAKTPNDAWIQFRFNTQEGMVADRLGFSDRAFASFEKALEFKKSTFVSFMAASTALYSKKPKVSVKYFKAVLSEIESRQKLNPSVHLVIGEAATLTNLSQCYLIIDDLEKAANFAQRAKAIYLEIIKVDENRNVELSNVYRLLAQIARENGESELSHQEIDEAIKQLSATNVEDFGVMDSKIATAQVYFQKASWLSREKKLKQAELLHKKIASIFLVIAQRDSLDITAQFWVGWLDERFQVYQASERVVVEEELIAHEIEMLLQSPDTLSKQFAAALLLSFQGRSLFFLGKSEDAKSKYRLSDAIFSRLSLQNPGPSFEVIRQRMQLNRVDYIDKLQKTK